ncbi:MAG: hypothetical protein AB1489_07255 [Acidobacteriota bacterium]
MIYWFYIVLTLIVIVVVPIVFYFTLAEFRSWKLIKERWFRAGIDNKMLFSAHLDAASGAEMVQLTGEYSGCEVTLATVKGKRSRASVAVSYPPPLMNRLQAEPQIVIAHMAKLLGEEADETSEEQAYLLIALPDRSQKPRRKRLHPHVSEQLLTLRKQYVRTGRRFELTRDELRYEQFGRLVEPSPLFAVLDEMVFTVNLLAENAEHLLVQ